MHDQEPAQASIRGSPDRVPPLQVRLPGLQPVPAPSQVFSLRGQATGQATKFLFLYFCYGLLRQVVKIVSIELI